MQRLSVMPRVVGRPMEMWRARDRQARHQDDVPLALVVVSGDLFVTEPVSEPAGHVALPVLRQAPSMRLAECPYERLAVVLAGAERAQLRWRLLLPPIPFGGQSPTREEGPNHE